MKWCCSCASSGLITDNQSLQRVEMIIFPLWFCVNQGLLIKGRLGWRFRYNCLPVWKWKSNYFLALTDDVKSLYYLVSASLILKIPALCFLCKLRHQLVPWLPVELNWKPQEGTWKFLINITALETNRGEITPWTTASLTRTKEFLYATAMSQKSKFKES